MTRTRRYTSRSSSSRIGSTGTNAKKRPPRRSLLNVGCERSVRRGQHLRLLQLHGDATTLDLARARLDAEDLGAAGLALESLAQLVRHGALLLATSAASAGRSRRARLRRPS